MWLGLIGVCIAGIVSVADPNARELTASVAWAADQLIGATVGLLGAGVAGWIGDNRFAIATVVLVLALLDMIALAMIRSWRAAARQQPRVRLREWVEVPLPSRAPAAPARPYALDVANRRAAAALTFACAWLLATALSAAIWIRDVFLPRGARRLARAAVAGRVHSKAGLESVRDTAAQLQFAARAWYDAAAAPAVSTATARASSAMRTAAASRRDAFAGDDLMGRVVKIQSLLSAESIGWYGPLIAATMDSEAPGDEDGAEPRSDRLAS